MLAIMFWSSDRVTLMGRVDTWRSAVNTVRGIAERSQVTWIRRQLDGREDAEVVRLTLTPDEARILGVGVDAR